MWFDPGALAKNKQAPPANLANSANYDPENRKAPPLISKLSELAEGALSKIRKTGFDVTLVGDSFEVAPSSKLTETQREFLKSHKAEIMEALELERGLVERVEIPPPLNDGLTVVCYTPAGNPVSVQARDADHAAWLLKMNPHQWLKKGLQNDSR